LADDVVTVSSPLDQAIANSQVEPLISYEEMEMDYFVPPQFSTTPVSLVAKASSNKSPKILKPSTMCTDIGSGIPNSALNTFTVLKYADLVKNQDVRKYKVRMLQAPEHGRVIQTGDALTIPLSEMPIAFTSSDFMYQPIQDYIGKDRAVFLVEANNRQYKVTVNFWVMDFVYDPAPPDLYCKSQKFGLGIDAVHDLAAWQKSSDLMNLLADASQSFTGFSNLAGTAVGQTNGEGAAASITLDSNAAGHGWYVDATPADNTDDFLPTADAGVWQAKAGTVAATQMDLLSVLLHEYGHALGLEHSANPRDFMSASLQPGIRRLPTHAELQLMSDLVAKRA
jgi:Matrixin